MLVIEPDLGSFTFQGKVGARMGGGAGEGKDMVSHHYINVFLTSASYLASKQVLCALIRPPWLVLTLPSPVLRHNLPRHPRNRGTYSRLVRAAPCTVLG